MFMTLSESENVSHLDTLRESGAKIDVAASTSLGSAAHSVQRRRSSMWK